MSNVDVLRKAGMGNGSCPFRGPWVPRTQRAGPDIVVWSDRRIPGEMAHGAKAGMEDSHQSSAGPRLTW